MIFQKSIQKELSRNFSTTLIIIVTIVMTMILIRTLGFAAHGQVNPAEVLLVMAYTVLGHSSTILGLSLCISVVNTFIRIVRDSEMAIWLTSGKSIFDFIKPLFIFLIPVLLTVTLMSTIVWPWANTRLQDLRTYYERRSDLEQIAPGEFKEMNNGSYLFYMDKIDDKNNFNSLASNIFIYQFNQDREIVTSAQSGRSILADGEKLFLLNNGAQLIVEYNKQNIKFLDFEIMGYLISPKTVDKINYAPNARSTWALLSEKKPDNLGEISWRVGIILASFTLALFGFVSISSAPRNAKVSQLIFSILCFVTYYNLINVGQNWIASARIGFMPVFFMIHGCIALFVVMRLFFRQYKC